MDSVRDICPGPLSLSLPLSMTVWIIDGAHIAMERELIEFQQGEEEENEENEENEEKEEEEKEKEKEKEKEEKDKAFEPYAARKTVGASV